MEIVWPVLLSVLLLFSWGLTLVGLPGNWLMLALCATYTWAYALNERAMMSWGTVAAIALVVILAEVVEFIAGAAGVAKGGSRRGAILAIVGSFVGAFVGASLGSVVPVFGTVVGLLLGASFGAMAGAMLGERSLGKDADFQWEIGKMAFWGKFWGSLGKMTVGAVIVGMAIASLLL